MEWLAIALFVAVTVAVTQYLFPRIEQEDKERINQ
jgi:hypothetical protein